MALFDEEKQNKQLADLRKQEEEQLVATLAESKYGLPYIDLYRLGIDNEALRSISEKDSREMNVAPFKLFGKNAIKSFIYRNYVHLKISLFTKRI